MEANNLEDEDVHNLLTVPEEVFSGHLFPFLKLNDLLRLRRVCKHLKLFSDDFIRTNFTTQEREINDTTDTFEDFINRDFPTSKLFLNNTNNPYIFEDPLIPIFLKVYAPQVTHLRVSLFSTCVSKKEKRFFSAFVNLQHLEIAKIDATDRDLIIDGPEYRDPNGVMKKITQKKCYFPPNFASLKTLKLNEVKGYRKMDLSYAWNFLEFCPNLEHFRHPFETRGYNHDDSEGDLSGHVLHYVDHRAEHFPFKLNLKFYDVQHLHGDLSDAMFIMFYHKRGVTLLNLDGQHYDSFYPTNKGNFPKFLHLVRSLQNFNGCLTWIEWPQLEKLVIQSTALCTFKKAWDGQEIPKWPGLEILEITIDSKLLKKTSYLEARPTGELVQFLVGLVEREKLTSLGVRFDTKGELKEDLPVPKAQDIVRCCGNLTKLMLGNWLGTNKAVSMLWKGLRHLEEVRLEDCEALGNVAFVGEEKERPTFLRLEKLKKFSLLGLELMPKITDLVFTLVFCHLKIKQFRISSRQPIKSITVNGIRALATGEFNNCVEKFPFNGWSLADVPDSEMTQLKSEFRATYML